MSAKRWGLFITIALILGTLLRVLYVQDMEYKEDEEYNFTQTQIVSGLSSWPTVGMPSGVYLQNPGMSVWVFIALAKLARATEPTELARALQIFALLGIALLIPFAWKFLKDKEREPWLWALALALVNPFAVFYQRKLWPEPFLPFFSMLMLMGWWRREKRWGAFVWGLIGAWLGQIHMSGFFYAGAFFLWTLLFDPYRSEPKECAEIGRKTKWLSWFVGSCLGALPLIPWLMIVLSHPVGGKMASGFSEASQLKYWVFWLTDPLGLHLGNPLGLLRGPSLAQISDFVRYPLIAGHATYLNGLAHLVVLGAALLLLCRGAWVWVASRELSWTAKLKRLVVPQTRSEFAVSAGFWGCGLMLTLTTVMIRRYYMMVTFPLEFVWLTSIAFLGVAGGVSAKSGKLWNPRIILGTLWAAELFISANFVGYVHVNEGAVQGDYGSAYHVIMKERAGAKTR